MTVFLVALSLSLTTPHIERQLAVKRKILQEEKHESIERSPICKGKKKEVEIKHKKGHDFREVIFNEEREVEDLCGDFMI